MYRLKQQYKLTEQEKTRIRALNELFLNNTLNLLDGGKLNKRIADEIATLYREKLGHITFGWGTTLLECELEDLKKDSITNGNTNKKHWLMAYMLSWLAELPQEPNDHFFFSHLTTREASRQLVNEAYEWI